MSSPHRSLGMREDWTATASQAQRGVSAGGGGCVVPVAVRVASLMQGTCFQKVSFNR